MKDRKKRGRPRNETLATVVTADQIIGLTVHALSMWGFPLRRATNGIYEVVGEAAREILRRVDHKGLALGPDRIEQIYKAWRKSERARRNWRNWDGISAALPALQEPWRYDLRYLRRLRPRQKWGIRRYAKSLLKNGGKWRYTTRVSDYSPPLMLTPKAEKEQALLPRLAKRKTG